MSNKTLLLEPISYPEIFLGLVAPIGVDLEMVEECLRRSLTQVRYDCQTIHISKLMDAKEHQREPLHRRYQEKMDAGNHYRRQSGKEEILALMSIARIRHSRRKINKDNNGVVERQAYVLRQLKTPKEIDVLRKVYGDNFFQISAYAPFEDRVKNLTEKLKRDDFGNKNIHYYKMLAYELIHRDDNEAYDKYGQKLSETYHLADIIVDARDKTSCYDTCERAINAIFDHPFISPTREEYGAHLAYSASLRSSDLSRQVGAAILSQDGKHIALACNDVPTLRGGTYWEWDTFDPRDQKRGYDANGDTKNEIISDLLHRLSASGWLCDELKGKSTEELVKLAKDDGKPENSLLEGASVNNLLEFTRVVHAEMNAISDAARSGISTLGSTLYCTTFPCHNCARHIVASGIKKVYFIEPYSKSIVDSLYDDMIQIDDPEYSGHKVLFLPFVGITPILYERVFRKYNKRKDKNGKAIVWTPQTAKPISRNILPTYVSLETYSIIKLRNILKESGLQVRDYID